MLKGNVSMKEELMLNRKEQKMLMAINKIERKGISIISFHFWN